MLEEEGFRYDGYIDIFDGGPAVSIRTEQLRTVREARKATLGGVMPPGSGVPAIVASGRGNMFNATFADIDAQGDSVLIDAAGRSALSLDAGERSEEHTSELQSIMRISYAVFCLKKKKKQ